MLSKKPIEICLLFAKLVFKLMACNLLKQKHQTKTVTTNIKNSNNISFGVILSISPTKNEEYLEKFPPLERITSPIAVLKEENTEIIVSFDIRFICLILLSSKANMTANTTIDIFVSEIPSIMPIAIPVNAECPKASEKNASLLFTIIVPKIPNSGVMINIAINAFFIKSYDIKSYGINASNI